MNSKEIFSAFEFDANWTKKQQFWDEEFDARYLEVSKDQNRPPVKIFVSPHSHNDPGWLKTFEKYFEDQTKHILDLTTKKLPQFEKMKFIWSEISFLNLWWEQAKPAEKQILKKLIDEGRLEITTGGWVMTDEANSHIYAMLDQLIEGHQWLKTYLNITPRSGWSVDPFGHGSTVPYLLASSGFEGTIIQRIHYGWKQVRVKNQGWKMTPT
jgi:alpha-mannosidase